jgi:UDP-glucose 4-epimerase
MTTTTKAAAGPILITGGAGYIGSHTIVCLLEKGFNVVVVDNLVNSSLAALDRVAELVNLDDDARKERLVFHNVDICDRDALKKVFETSPKFHACIHFAGLKVNKNKNSCWLFNLIHFLSWFSPVCTI